MPYASEKRQALTAIFIVFLFIFSEILVAENDYNLELNDHNPSYSIYSYSPNSEVHISSEFPDFNYNSNSENNVGINQLGGEERALYKFSNNLSKSSDLILDAELRLTCEVLYQQTPSQLPVLYPATIYGNFAPSEVTWNSIANSIAWQKPGVDGEFDRKDWDVPSSSASITSNIYEYNLNVTKLVQTSLHLGRSTFDIIISGLGGNIACAKGNNVTTSYHPELIISHSSGFHSDGGSVEQNFAVDGVPLMKNDFIMAADINPRISFDNLVGTDVEFQFSLSSDFRNITDLTWIYSTLSNQFTTSGAAGYYNIPNSESFPLGSIIHHRIRSIDNTSKISDWSEGYFLLPDYNTVNNSDGTATITLGQNDFNLMGTDFIEDTYIDTSAIQGHGEEQYLYVSNDVNDNKISLLKINFNMLGIHSNATIVSASLELDRQTVTSQGPTLSLHPIEHSLWSESEATWNYGKIGQQWANGGLNQIGSSEQSNIDSNSASNTFDFDIQNSLQKHLDESSNVPLSYVLTGFLPDDSPPSQLEEIKFASSEFQGVSGNTPSVSLTYSWTANQSIPDVELISPINTEPVWEIENDNLSGDTTPELEWQSSDGVFMDYFLQVSNDPLFRDVILDLDSRDLSLTSLTALQNYTFTSSNQLSKGDIYHWRIKQVDGDGRIGDWNASSLFISTLESEWLGGNMFRFILNNSVDSNVNSIPGFKFSSIASNSPTTNSYGYSNIFIADTMSLGKYNALLGLNLQSYLLPQGYAVISSNLTMTTVSSTNSPNVGVWELVSDDWNEQEVTWIESSSGIQWDSPGATGTLDRVNLLSNSSVASNCCTVWNVTSSVQNSMRDGKNLNFMLEIMPGYYGSTAIFNSPLSQDSQDQPQLEIIFTLGSNQKPTPPTAQSPADGEWVFKNNSTLETDIDLDLSWNNNSPMPIVGWAIEIDSSSNFDSIDKRSITSWNDPGFDIAGCEYELQSSLDIGKVWYWRVRGLSNTFQLGEWSQSFTFFLPDLNYHPLTHNSFTTEYSHGSAFSNQQMINFADLHINDRSTLDIVNGETESILSVGRLADGANNSMLISVPIPLAMHPENASLTSAMFSLEATPLSSANVRLAVREVLTPWDLNANNFRYNSTNNWSELGGRGIGSDVSEPLDIVMSQVGKNVWNITQIAQRALAEGRTSLSLMIYSDTDLPGQLVYFYSSDFSNTKPTINMTWVEGQRTIPSDIIETILPLDGQIYFNQTSHAILPELRPTFTWSLPQSSVSTPDAWRIFFQLDPNNDMEGDLMFDSRVNPELFDLVTLSFTPDQDINFGNSINWSVQPIEQEMLGQRSNQSMYFIPNSIGQEINQTDATIYIQDGSLFPPTNYPSATSDIYLDEGNPYQSNDTGGIRVGNSTILNSNLSSITSIVSFNLSTLTLPSVYEIISADLELTAVNGSGAVDISASRILANWDENSTWDNSSSGVQWINSGALRGADSDLPDSMVYVDSIGTFSWNVTRILQLTVESNQDVASILLQPEVFNSPTGIVEGSYIFADSENTNISLRPKLSIQYRTVESWLPPTVSLISPANGSTLWNESSPSLVGADNISFEVSQPVSNHTTINLCHGTQIRWLDCVQSTSNVENYSWDSILNLFNYTDIDEIESNAGDQWQYWRFRVDQEHRIGHYSPIYHYRIPENQAIFDGYENYTVELSRGSVFTLTGDNPMVSDASTDSSNNLNLGQSPTISVGTNPSSGGVFEAYFEYNLSELYFVPTATPISMTLELEVISNMITQSPIAVSVYACDGFEESLISYQSTPTCSTSEITRTSITGTSGNLVSWDLTYLGQTNFFTNNDTLSFKLTAVSGQNNFIEFHSSESINGMKPTINLTYIENINQYLPPSQPLPISPSDGEILYDVSNLPINSVQSVQLEWTQVSSATSYKLFINTESGLLVFDSLIDSGFSGNTFTSSIFSPGESYEWWVQCYNQSIPGPPSPKWIFGLGNPDNFDNKDGTLTYAFSDSSEILDFNHINFYDTWITDSNLDVNYGVGDNLEIGGGCQNTINSICDAIISVDTSQIPLDSNSQSIHSIVLNLFVESWDLTGGAYQVEFSIHEFLYTNWDEMTLTWNNTGINPGPQPGVDFVSQPLDVKTYNSLDTVFSFDVGEYGQSIGDVLTFLIRGTPISTGGNFDGYVSVYSSDYSDINLRPKLEILHTNVSILNITSQTVNYNADGSYSFDVQAFDSNGQAITGGIPNMAEIEWSTTSGSITPNQTTQSAVLSPTISGMQVVSACYGIICTDYAIMIEPGMPMQIFASLNQTSDVNFATITADDTLQVSAYAIDQFGNLVTNEVISFFSSNGSIDSSGLFSPYSAGIHTVTAEWVGSSNTLQETLQVEVLPGAPVLVELSGCGDIIHADTSCDIFGTAFDQYSNIVWFDDVGDYTLSVSDGEIIEYSTPTPHTSPPTTEVLIGEYTGNLVGQSTISFVSENSLVDSILVDVTHGAFASFELEASSTSISADEILYLNTTRIDVRGNRLAVILPIENWTSVADGQVVT
ncbi:MAG TPA: DNRLRE domain-containing protein, partial [Candidatus Poseidoniaceae archaeon]